MKTQTNQTTLSALVLSGLALSLSAMQSVKAVSWVATGSMKTPRLYHTATLLRNGNVLVTGGFDGTNNLSSAELYDPSTGMWTEAGSMSSQRSYHTATLLPNGKILVAGGSGTNTLSTAELYDPVAATWTLTGLMSTQRLAHTATLLSNGLVLVAGGYNTDGVLSSSELFDPAAGTWTPTGDLSSGIEGEFGGITKATLLISGEVLLAGGVGGSSEWSGAQLYDPLSGLWTTTADMNVDRQGPTATLLTNGQVLVAGGISAISGPQSSSELYDPDTGTWTITGSMHASRYSNHAAVLLPNGQVLVSGGALGGIGPLSSSELYNPSLGSWSITGSMKVGRGWHTMTLLANGQVLAVGGSGPPSDGGFHALASAELYGSPNVTPIFLSNPVTLPGGAFQFGFTNTHGATFSVLGTSDASMAVSNWTGLGTASEISPGNFQFVDTQATNNPQRFYRVRAP